MSVSVISIYLHCLQPKELYTPVFFSVGDFCVSFFSEDEQWYRARIEKADKGAVSVPTLSLHPPMFQSFLPLLQFFVRYIDFGNCEERRLEHLKPLKSEFRQLPPQALLCSIASADHQQFTQPVSGEGGRVRESALPIYHTSHRRETGSLRWFRLRRQ